MVGISFRQRYRDIDNKSFDITPSAGSQSESTEVVVAKDADIDGVANSEDDYQPYYDYDYDYDYEDEPYYEDEDDPEE